MFNQISLPGFIAFLAYSLGLGVVLMLLRKAK